MDKEKEIKLNRAAMNRQAIFHLSESPYSFPLSEKEFFFRLRLGIEDKEAKVYVHYGNKFFLAEMKKRIEMPLARVDGLFAYFEVIAPLEDNRVGYVFEIEEGGKTYYYTERGLLEEYVFKDCYKDYFEYSCVHPEDPSLPPAWTKNAVFYQIFPDRFRLGDESKDKSYITMDWFASPKPGDFAGGDLKGIADSIGYLSSLGINAIYLTPIFKAMTSHKYDTIDYMRIDPQFGTEEDLSDLLAKAHQAGIKVVLDAVFNHVSALSPFFQDAVKKGKESPYFDWFYVEGDAIDFKKRNYQTFSLARYMPKLKVTNPETEAYLFEVVLHYLRLGIDGWRFDVGDEISHSFIRKVREKVKAAFPEALMLGEHWHNAHSFLRGDEYDGVMNYPFTYAAYDYIIYGKDDARRSAFRLNELYTHYRFQNALACLNLLDSHDTHRFLNLASGNEAKLQCAIAMEFFFPGMSCLYYGTEIPMDGGFDPDCRRGFPYETALKGSKHMEVVKQLIKIRKDPRLGSYHFLAKEENGLLILSRGEGKSLKLAINQTGKDVVFDKAPIYSVNLEGNLLHNDGFAIFE